MTDTSTAAPPAPVHLGIDPDWWRTAVVYQVYPRSFSDGNGDGIGDFVGLTARVTYLRALGVDAVWLSPFYPSALADGGYDVDDYRDIDPRIGTLADFDALVAALHGAGIRIIVDIVPNHTSDRHRWFREALRSPAGSPARDRYIFRDGLGDNGDRPPTDWPSGFGGPAWERVIEPDGTPGQWYLHLFSTEQPDLNWDHPDVQADFLRTLRFWADRGVDGFRIDVAHMLKKDLTTGTHGVPEIHDIGAFPDGRHPFFDRDDVPEIYRRWRAVFDEYDPPRMAVAEAWVPAHRRSRYAAADGLGQAFNFDLLKADFDPEQFRDVISRNLAEAEAGRTSSTWVFSNHDVVRHATRYGIDDPRTWLLDGGDPSRVDHARGLRRARAATLLMLALPGSAYLYQGEELGLPEVGEIPDQARQDPVFRRSPGVEVGRDGCRVPLPWQRTGPSFGFGRGPAHLPQPAWFADYAVSAQEMDPASTLRFYRRALTLRRRLLADSSPTLEWLDCSRSDVLRFRRPGGWQVITNFGRTPVRLPDGEVLLSSEPVDGTLPGDVTAWIRG